LDPLTTPYKYANCGGNHPAVSRSCQKLIEHTTKKTNPNPNQSKGLAPNGFTRVNSAFVNNVNIQAPTSSLRENYRNSTANKQPV